MSSSALDKARDRGRWTLLGIFMLFFIPVMLAWLLNIETPAWLPSARTNHGDLIQPPLSFPLADLRTVDARPLPTQFLQGKWSLVSIQRTSCLADCDRTVYRSRQVRYALGKDMDRIQRVLVTALSNVRETAKKVQKYDGNVSVVAAEPEWFERASFVRAGVEIYLVDPQGYLILTYARTADPSGLISDLERLLKISKIG